MFKSVQDALEEQEWSEIPIEVYFYWNVNKLKNSGQIHIKSKSKIGFFDGEIVHIYVDGTQVLIVSTGTMRTPGEKAKDKDIWRVLTQGNLKVQDFDFKHRSLLKLLKIQFPVNFKAKKVRVCNYVKGIGRDTFGILVDTK